MKLRHYIYCICSFLIGFGVCHLIYKPDEVIQTPSEESVWHPNDVYMEESSDEHLSYSFIEIPDSILDEYDIYELCYVRSGYWKLHIGDKALRPMYIGFKTMPSWEQIENWPSVRYLLDLAKYHVKSDEEEQVYENEYAVVFIRFCH